jgi:hypothetical protein
VSSGNRTIYRLARRGNRQLNHAIHMAAVSQIRYPGTIGRTYYDRKLAEGMAHKSALRSSERDLPASQRGRKEAARGVIKCCRAVNATSGQLPSASLNCCNLSI